MVVMIILDHLPDKEEAWGNLKKDGVITIKIHAKAHAKERAG